MASPLLRRLRSARAGFEMTPSQAVALSRLGHEGPLSGPPGPRRARAPAVTRTTLAALEDRGLVTRTPHPTDQRQILLSLSAEGERLLRLAHHAKETGWRPPSPPNSPPPNRIR
ncbi:MarR family transcriptional regulator [Nocardia sp. NPDC059764]|uniref:MarR family transcriptional regulator n=1 Tax=Nocardia sp. NPDC059764 TaxID=3346939 RepID=UPI00364C0C09